jgi:polysaccharide export outer membrane protein
VDQIYNQPATQTTGGQSPLSGYLVDINGNIELPRIGLVKAEGLKKSELEEVVKAKLGAELTRPSVIVRFMNFRITVLGEVGAPGVLNVPTERLTILEALGMAGGITEYGAVKRVKVLRENNGVREIAEMDLTSKDIFNSPFYQLQQNDVVLVDQSEYKISEAQRTRTSQQIGLATGIISTIVIIIAIFK